MVILFALWFILQWQFPMWLWIISGFFYVISLKPKRKIKKQISLSGKVLPLYLALAIIFGTDTLGNSILPDSSSIWVVIGILTGSVFIRLIISSPVIKKQFSKSKKTNKNITIAGDGIILNGEDDGLKLHIAVNNKEKNKKLNFKINLENGFIKEVFVKKIIIKGIQENHIFNDESGKPLFDIYEIYDKAKKSLTKGEVLSIDNEKVTIVISIR